MKKALVSLLLGVSLCGMFSTPVEAKSKKPVKIHNDDCVVEVVSEGTDGWNEVTITNNSNYLVKSVEYVYEMKDGFWDEEDECVFTELDGFEKGETSEVCNRIDRSNQEPVLVRYTIEKKSAIYYIEWSEEKDNYTVYDMCGKKLYNYKG